MCGERDREKVCVCVCVCVQREEREHREVGEGLMKEGVKKVIGRRRG